MLATLEQAKVLLLVFQESTRLTLVQQHARTVPLILTVLALAQLNVRLMLATLVQAKVLLLVFQESTRLTSVPQHARTVPAILVPLKQAQRRSRIAWLMLATLEQAKVLLLVFQESTSLTAARPQHALAVVLASTKAHQRRYRSHALRALLTP